MCLFHKTQEHPAGKGSVVVPVKLQKTMHVDGFPGGVLRRQRDAVSASNHVHQQSNPVWVRLHDDVTEWWRDCCGRIVNLGGRVTRSDAQLLYDYFVQRYGLPLEGMATPALVNAQRRQKRDPDSRMLREKYRHDRNQDDRA